MKGQVEIYKVLKVWVANLVINPLIYEYVLAFESNLLIKKTNTEQFFFRFG